MLTPDFWSKRSLMTRLLWPLSAVYGLGTALHRQKKPWRGRLPVICVGNLTAGGAGKTPVAIALAKLIKEQAKKKVHILTRGYGGVEKGPIKVMPGIHQAKEVGDEPLLLAQIAPTWVGADRKKSARSAFGDDAEIIVMDDGFQHHGIHKDLSVVVIDGGYGFGNRFLLPAGPLREPITAGLKRADAIVFIGEDKTGAKKLLPPLIPVLEAELVPCDGFKDLKGQRVIAFAGIARPKKFFDMLEGVGAVLVEKYAFADHKAYTSGQIRSLIWQAKQCNAILVTTSKDGARLWPEAKKQVTIVDVSIRWKDEAAVKNVLAKAVTF